jgi:hypothetical protein
MGKLLRVCISGKLGNWRLARERERERERKRARLTAFGAAKRR